MNSVSSDRGVIARANRMVEKRCDEARKAFERDHGERQEAVTYNDRLANHWKPGISTRDTALEAAEMGAFHRLVAHCVANSGTGGGRPQMRPLVVDLGGGTGKVLDWIRGLEISGEDSLTYVYTDFSPRMRDEARARFESMRGAGSMPGVKGHFIQCDLTRPMFKSRDWSLLRSAFHPIVAVCAGGTIGNLGDLEAFDNSAQHAAFEHYLRPSDASLCTVLDPHKIEVSLSAYAKFGREAGLYDAQDAVVFKANGDPSTPETVRRLRVPFQPGLFEPAVEEISGLIRNMSGEPTWVKLDMLKKGEPVGQVTRHYSERYVKSLFLRDCAVREKVVSGRAYVLTLSGAGSRRGN